MLTHKNRKLCQLLITFYFLICTTNTKYLTLQNQILFRFPKPKINQNNKLKKKN